MFTIGTSSTRFLRTKINPSDPAYDALGVQDSSGNFIRFRLASFVGTAADRAKVIIAPYICFFELQGTNPETVLLWIPQDSADPTNLWPEFPDDWVQVGAAFNEGFITEWLIPAGGYMNAQYAFQRGNLADMEHSAVFKAPGIPFFAKDISSLFIWNETEGQFVSVTVAQTGMILIWPQFLPVPSGGWLRCDGSWIDIAQYNKLFNIIGHSFDDGTAPPGKFALPLQDNAIVRYV